jgi:hypothetical protein
MIIICHIFGGIMIFSDLEHCIVTHDYAHHLARKNHSCRHMVNMRHINCLIVICPTWRVIKRGKLITPRWCYPTLHNAQALLLLHCAWLNSINCGVHWDLCYETLHVFFYNAFFVMCSLANDCNVAQCKERYS